VDALGTIVNAAVVAVVGILLAWYTKGRFDQNENQHSGIEAKLAEHDVRFEALDARVASLEARLGSLDTRVDSFERSLNSMRSDLTRVALAVGAGPSAEAGG
jgi:septal ring factor EnvC (AmiA/AmiB activator)